MGSPLNNNVPEGRSVHSGEPDVGSSPHQVLAVYIRGHSTTTWTELNFDLFWTDDQELQCTICTCMYVHILFKLCQFKTLKHELYGD